jgi:hypothetical protein
VDNAYPGSAGTVCEPPSLGAVQALPGFGDSHELREGGVNENRKRASFTRDKVDILKVSAVSSLS